jgi:hypothetical protein
MGWNPQWSDSITNMITHFWRTAEEHGWHEDEHQYNAFMDRFDGFMNMDMSNFPEKAQKDQGVLKYIKNRFFAHGGVQVMEKLMLIVTEVAEAAEDYRRKGIPLQELYYLDTDDKRQPMTMEAATKGMKPLGFPSEVADAAIRIFELCGQLSVDLAHAMRCKAAYNETREFRHGNKTC